MRITNRYSRTFFTSKVQVALIIEALLFSSLAKRSQISKSQQSGDPPSFGGLNSKLVLSEVEWILNKYRKSSIINRKIGVKTSKII